MAHKLAESLSPYLLQHAENPVDWHPWGQEALAKAKAENKPLLLSVGYAACHWCHVMAHESFENPAIAAIMNEHFVNIKIDREERPDLDALYQNALALMGQQGGWPLTMFCTPDGHPFAGGTYFPPEPRYGRPGFPEVLTMVARTWADEPDKVEHNLSVLQDALTQLSYSAPGDSSALTTDMLDDVAAQLVKFFDPEHGGLRGAPKFPNTAILELLWRAHLRTGDETLKEAVTTSLTAMCQGGIFDHLGGGFARYSTDHRWLVPHFEKMLYDNAMLLYLLALVWQRTKNPLYEQRARETVGWLQREMMVPEGAKLQAFAATLDADSEGEEGRFYVWTEAEIDGVLLSEEAALFKAIYDVSPAGNWEGVNILNRLNTPESLGLSEEKILASAREKLLKARQSRVRPGRDDKVLPDWNGLMIFSLAHAGRIFDIPEWTQLAETAFAFIAESLEGETYRLSRIYRNGRASGRGLLEDYASMARAAVALHEVTGRVRYLDHARGYLAVLDDEFADAGQGGYYQSPATAMDVAHRIKSAEDSATPSGNGMLVEVLARLSLLEPEGPWDESLDRQLRAFAGNLSRSLLGMATFLNGLETRLLSMTVELQGKREDEVWWEHYQILRECVPPHAVWTCRPSDAATRVMLCRGGACLPPIGEPGALSEAIRAWA